MKSILKIFILFFLTVVSFIGHEIQAMAFQQGVGLKTGGTAPDFSAMTVAGKKITLSHLYKKGPIALIFYSGGWCPVCSLYLKSLHPHWEDFKKAGITIIAISTDSSGYSREVVKKDKLGFDVISDPRGAILEAYHVRYIVPKGLAWLYIRRYHLDANDYAGRKSFTISVPAEYVVNRIGKIVYAKADFKDRAKPEEILDSIFSH